MTGHSYVGSTPSVAAAQNPTGLETIVPSAGLASMYHHQFQAGVPYMLQWTGVQWSYNYLTVAADLPPVGARPGAGRRHGRRLRQQPGGDRLRRSRTRRSPPARTSSPAATPTGTSSATGTAARRRPTSRSSRVHGINDNAARVGALEWFFERRNPRGQAVAGPVGPRLGLLPDPSRHPVDRRAARVVRQAPRAARREHGPAGRAVHGGRPVVQRGSHRRAHRDPHGAELAGRRRHADASSRTRTAA